MKGFAGLNRRDTILLSVIGLCSVLLIVVLAVFGPAKEINTTPSAYSNTTHGARAAYLLLKRAGYHVVRSTSPLDQIARNTTPNTTYIFADPFFQQTVDAEKQVKEILARGGRVLVTGASGALLLPLKHRHMMSPAFSVTCIAHPDGLSGLASSGDISIVEEAAWGQPGPAQSVIYRCGKDPVVVAFPLEKGSVVWWASSTPLENGSITQDGNLDLLLNSIGPRATTQVVWDESLHAEPPSLLSWTAGTVLPYVWWQLGLLALLLLFSFSRRSGPLRPDPVTVRAAPLEFVQSLGSLYEKAGAANVAVSVAYQNFRMRLEKIAGIGLQTPVEEVTGAVQRRYPGKPEVAKVIEVVAGVSDEGLKARDALKLVRTLQDAEREII